MPEKSYRLNVNISKEAKENFAILLACKKGIYKNGANLSKYLMESAINNEYKKLTRKRGL